MGKGRPTVVSGTRWGVEAAVMLPAAGGERAGESGCDGERRRRVCKAQVAALDPTAGVEGGQARQW